MQFDLSDCSIVVPVHVDSKERLEHVQFLLAYFKKYFINYRLILTEIGREPKVPASTDPQVQIQFVEQEMFSPADVNWGASLVTTPYFCKWDADALIHPKAIFDAFEVLKNNPNQSFVYPLKDAIFNIADPLRKKILQTIDLTPLPLFRKGTLNSFLTIPNISVCVLNPTGMIHVFRLSVFKELGGYNEEFVGWGYEDDEIVNRFEKFGHPRVYLKDYIAYHFVHPRVLQNAAQVFKNLCRMGMLKGASLEEVRLDMQRWSRFMK